MTPRDLRELIWAKLDGELSAAEAQELERHLAASPEARALEQEARDLTRVLSQVEEIAIPADLKASARSALDQLADSTSSTRATNVFDFQLYSEQARASEDTRSTVPKEDPTIPMSKRAFPIGLAAIVLLVLGVVFVTNSPSVDTEDLQGTIGTAKKYAADQISAADVQLSDSSIQEWMQSDVFDRLSRDPEAQAALANDAFRDALANDAFRSALTSDAFRSALTNDAFRSALSNDALRSALANDAFRSALSNDALRNALSNDALRDAARPR